MSAKLNTVEQVQFAVESVKPVARFVLVVIALALAVAIGWALYNANRVNFGMDTLLTALAAVVLYILGAALFRSLNR